MRGAGHAGREDADGTAAEIGTPMYGVQAKLDVKALMETLLRLAWL